MKITLLASFLVMAAYFLLLYAGVGLIQEKKFFSSAPREVFAAVPERKSERFRGAQVIFLPAQWTAARQYHWETLTAARAIENQLFVVSCNACGERDGTLYGGFSRIIDPLGAVLAQGGGEEEIVTADLDLSSIAPLRARVPVFHDRRPALYRL